MFLARHLYKKMWVKIRLLYETQLPRLPGSALKVCGGVGKRVIMWSIQLELS